MGNKYKNVSLTKERSEEMKRIVLMVLVMLAFGCGMACTYEGDEGDVRAGDTIIINPPCCQQEGKDITVNFSLANDAPSGTVFEGSWNVYKFQVATDQGTAYFSKPEFEYLLDGQLGPCSLWEGNSLLSSSYLNSTYGMVNYVSIDKNEDVEPLLITNYPRTFSLWCQVSTNSDNQTLQIQLAAARYQPTEPEDQVYFTYAPWSNGLTFVKREIISVQLAWDTPTLINLGLNTTVMEFEMKTSVGEAKLYNFEFRWDRQDFQSGTIKNCHLEDSNGDLAPTYVSGGETHNELDQIWNVFFFGPTDAEYPGDDYNFLTINTTTKTFKMVCDVFAEQDFATYLWLTEVRYYDTGISYQVLPQTYPIISTVFHQ
jgi:hypothetical protein